MNLQIFLLREALFFHLKIEYKATMLNNQHPYLRIFYSNENHLEFISYFLFEDYVFFVFFIYINSLS